MTMMTKLFVGNLSYGTTADDLRDLFSQFGRVISAQIVTDRQTGASRGFGFVELAEGAEEAIEALNGFPLHGRALTVNEAKSREEGSSGVGSIRARSRPSRK